MMKQHPEVSWEDDDYDLEAYTSWFSQKFSEANFFKCWNYMSGYVSYQKSSPLGKYFIKSKWDPFSNFLSYDFY
jgi:hypothetical protein